MKSWSKGQDYSMILITEPAKERGQAFLKRDKEMWNWLPSIDRMIKIPPSMMMQSWMGSDFTNDDLVRESSIVKDFTHYLEGEETIRGYEAYRIRLDPKPDAAVVWGKIVIWVSKEDLLELKAEFYDEDGYLVNTMHLSDIREMGGRKLPTHWEMIPADEEGKKTVLQLISADFTVDIEESFFSQQNLKRLR
jgi:outer membrane lipoprotein-sorting protein